MGSVGDPVGVKTHCIFQWLQGGLIGTEQQSRDPVWGAHRMVSDVGSVGIREGDPHEGHGIRYMY
jgi:hypothetical protein